MQVVYSPERICDRWKEIDLGKKMHPQTETVKRFHARPQWQQILAVSTFLGKYNTKENLSWKCNHFCRNQFQHSLISNVKFALMKVRFLVYVQCVARDKFLITREFSGFKMFIFPDWLFSPRRLVFSLQVFTDIQNMNCSFNS